MHARVLVPLAGSYGFRRVDFEPSFCFAKVQQWDSLDVSIYSSRRGAMQGKVNVNNKIRRI
ncbi:MAG: hypothetical protein ACJA1L_000183 [Paracoccaceae bacterium]